MQRAGCVSGLSIYEVGYGAGFKIELMIGHKVMMRIFAGAHIAGVEAHARVT